MLFCAFFSFFFPSWKCFMWFDLDGFLWLIFYVKVVSLNSSKKQGPGKYFTLHRASSSVVVGTSSQIQQPASWDSQAWSPPTHGSGTFFFLLVVPDLLNLDSIPNSKGALEGLTMGFSYSPRVGEGTSLLHFSCYSHVGPLPSSEVLFAAFRSIGHPCFFFVLCTHLIPWRSVLIVCSHHDLYLGFVGIPWHLVLL